MTYLIVYLVFFISTLSTLDAVNISTSGAGSAALAVRCCAPGLPSLLQALSEPGISTVDVEGDYSLDQSPTYIGTLQLRSNVTVRGAPGIPTAPLVDLNFANEVINVCPGCVLTLADLVIANSRRGTGEGLDAITGEGAALRSMIVLRNVVQLRPACVPARDAGLALAETPRPAAAAGSQQQQYELRDVEFRGTKFASSLVVLDSAVDVPLTHREGHVPINSIHTDANSTNATTAANRDRQGHLGGYIIIRQNVSRVCRAETSQSCLAVKPADACVEDLLAATAAVATAAGAPTTATGSTAALAAAIAAPIFVVLVAALLGIWMLLRRRRRRQASLDVGTSALQAVKSSGPGPDHHSYGDTTTQSSSTDSVLCRNAFLSAAGRTRIDVRILQPEARQLFGGSMEGWEVAAMSTSPLLGGNQDVVVEFGELLGCGSYGRVFRVLWGGHDCALKVIEHDESTLEAVEAEAQLLLSLRAHPHVVGAGGYVSFVKVVVGGSSSSHGAPSCSMGRSINNSGVSGSDSAASASAGAIWPCSGTTTTTTTTATSCNAGSSSNDTQQPPGSAAGPGATLPVNSTWRLQRRPAKAETWLVLEFMDCGTLWSVVEALDAHGEQMQLLPRLLLLLDAAKGLGSLHAQSIVHGDINARNVLVCSSSSSSSSSSQPLGMCAKIADLGLSRVIKQHMTHRTTNSVGTLNHMAPEVLRWGRMSPAADIYSFGIMLWEVFMRKIAFDKLFQYGMLFESVVLHQLRPQLPAGAPPDFVLLMQRCWADDAAQRPSVMQLQTALQAMVDARTADSSCLSALAAVRQALALPVHDDAVQQQPASASMSGSPCGSDLCSPAAAPDDVDGLNVHVHSHSNPTWFV